MLTKLRDKVFEYYVGLFGLWLIFHTSQAEPHCQHSGRSCKITCTDIPNHGNITIDLSSIDSTTLGSPSFSNIEDSRGLYTYDWNPCTKFFVPGFRSCFDVNMCQESKLFSDEFNVGSVLKVVYNSKDKNIVLQYTGDGGRTSAVTMVYEESEKGRVTVVTESPPLHYSMTLYTKCTLNDSGSRSGGIMSTGTIILMIFFTILVLYVGIGIAFLKYKRQAHGKEINSGFLSKLLGPKRMDVFSRRKKRSLIVHL